MLGKLCPAILGAAGWDLTWCKGMLSRSAGATSRTTFAQGHRGATERFLQGERSGQMVTLQPLPAAGENGRSRLPSVCTQGKEDVMVMITASTYNRPSSAPSFIRGHSFPTATLSGRTCYPPTLQMRTQVHAEGPTQQVSISRAALTWSGVALCPCSLSSPGMHARQEAPEGGSLS